MSTYPIILNLDRRLAVVVGAGPVGCRKARGLLAAGACVRLVSLAPPVLDLPEQGLELRLKAFAAEDLDGALLVFAATGDPQVDAGIQVQARQRGLLVNCAGDRRAGDFHLPAATRCSDLLLTASTGGESPALARLVRDRLEQTFGREWGVLCQLATRLHSTKLTKNEENTYTYKVLEKLLDGGIIELIASHRTAAIDQLLTETLGRPTSLEQLDLDLRDDLP